MLRLLVYAAALMLTAGASWAGCANYTDGSMFSPAPRILVCFDGDCEETTLDYVCGSAHGSQWGYANGWRGAFSPEGTPRDLTDDKRAVWRPDGSILPEEDHGKLVCYAVDDDFVEGCGDRRPLGEVSTPASATAR